MFFKRVPPEVAHADSRHRGEKRLAFALLDIDPSGISYADKRAEKASRANLEEANSNENEKSYFIVFYTYSCEICSENGCVMRFEWSDVEHAQIIDASMPASAPSAEKSRTRTQDPLFTVTFMDERAALTFRLADNKRLDYVFTLIRERVHDSILCHVEEELPSGVKARSFGRRGREGVFTQTLADAPGGVLDEADEAAVKAIEARVKEMLGEEK